MRKRQPGPEGLQERQWSWSDEDEGGVRTGGGDGWGGEEERDADDERDSIIEKLIKRIGDQLESGETPARASVSDLIRLMQWERELHPRQAKKFVVEWIDPKPEEL